ncbi:uncharacterized protein LOC114278612 isoform X2 [Camellia sinensis]|nr:uncharacterized protein LOC114278612 isoform X2 [Camellia sinensis]
MEHLPIHLAEEAKIAGLVQYRWMYFIERCVILLQYPFCIYLVVYTWKSCMYLFVYRYLMTLKSYMRNQSHPEGSIAQGYLVEECMTFCSRYLHDVESKLHQPLRNCDVNDNPEILMGRALGKGKGFVLDNTTWVQAHRYMLFNIAAVVPYREEHREFIKRSHRHLRDYDVDRRHNDEFPKWFNSHILSMSSSFDHSSSESEQSSSSSSNSDETQNTLKMKVIPDPPASWHPPDSLPTTSRSGSTSHGSVSAGPSSSQATQKQTRGPTYVHGQ